MNHQLDLFVNVNISQMWRTIQFRVNQEKERAGQDKNMAANNDDTDSITVWYVLLTLAV